MFTKTTTRPTINATNQAFDHQRRRRHVPRRHPTIPRLDRCETRTLLSCGMNPTTGVVPSNLRPASGPAAVAPVSKVIQYEAVGITTGPDGNLWLTLPGLG